MTKGFVCKPGRVCLKITGLPIVNRMMHATMIITGESKNSSINDMKISRNLFICLLLTTVRSRIALVLLLLFFYCLFEPGYELFGK